jgi:hypothetical protein
VRDRGLRRAGLLAVVQQLGWRGIWGIEHMSNAHRQLPLDVGLQQAKDATRSCFDLAEEDGPATPR